MLDLAQDLQEMLDCPSMPLHPHLLTPAWSQGFTKETMAYCSFEAWKSRTLLELRKSHFTDFCVIDRKFKPPRMKALKTLSVLSSSPAQRAPSADGRGHHSNLHPWCCHSTGTGGTAKHATRAAGQHSHRTFLCRLFHCLKFRQAHSQ